MGAFELACFVSRQPRRGWLWSVAPRCASSSMDGRSRRWCCWPFPSGSLLSPRIDNPGSLHSDSGPPRAGGRGAAVPGLCACSVSAIGSNGALSSFVAPTVSRLTGVDRRAPSSCSVQPGLCGAGRPEALDDPGRYPLSRSWPSSRPRGVLAVPVFVHGRSGGPEPAFSPSRSPTVSERTWAVPAIAFGAFREKPRRRGQRLDRASRTNATRAKNDAPEPRKLDSRWNSARTS
ncbi:MAG: hypothetical protein JWP46_432 [Modestobacter sp.]|nr:hypothetical protein [Modestobacter sp.]